MDLINLQKRLKKFKLDAFLVSRNNLFLGQDIRHDENIIMQLTGFTGSAGTLLITPQKNFLFVDGRYELQAPQQVDKSLIEVICTTKLSLAEWINQNLANKKIGYNPWCWSINDILKFSTPQMVPESEFLPYLLSTEPIHIFEQPLEYCGQRREEKITNISRQISDKNLDAYFISAADSVSWLLNLRSDALPDSPVLRALAVMDNERHIWIFADNINSKDLPFNLTVLPLHDLPNRLKKFKKKIIGLDFNTTAAAFFELAQDFHIKLENHPDFCQLQKSIKNACELDGIRKAHIRDGVAVCKFLYWFEHNRQGKTELDIVNKLHDFRAKQQNFVSESFETIAAYGSNGAIVHYSPTAKTNKKIKDGSFLLLDSGAQYLDGTTDITRTIAVGNITPEMSEDFTLVLKAHIHLSSAIFPNRTSGAKLDTLAREVMWQEGKNYNHGTGHGVGCFLNVHEGPQFISAACHTPFTAGQITSIEPGYYREGKYGIRIENLAEICPCGFQEFLCFKNLTLVPIDSRAINKYLMTAEEREWLNQYHREVLKQITPHLSDDEKHWLEEACAPL